MGVICSGNCLECYQRYTAESNGTEVSPITQLPQSGVPRTQEIITTPIQIIRADGTLCEKDCPSRITATTILDYNSEH